jgi:hypothetical protein
MSFGYPWSETAPYSKAGVANTNNFVLNHEFVELDG